MTKAEKIALRSKKNFVKQCDRLYNKVYREIHLKIEHAVWKGATEAMYNFYNKENYTTEVIITVDQKMRNMLTAEGFYLRLYQFGTKKEPFEYTIAWGDGIARHTNLDAIQLNLMEERRREYAKNN